MNKSNEKKRQNINKLEFLSIDKKKNNEDIAMAEEILNKVTETTESQVENMDKKDMQENDNENASTKNNII